MSHRRCPGRARRAAPVVHAKPTSARWTVRRGAGDACDVGCTVHFTTTASSSEPTTTDCCVWSTVMGRSVRSAGVSRARQVERSPAGLRPEARADTRSADMPVEDLDPPTVGAAAVRRGRSSPADTFDDVGSSFEPVARPYRRPDLCHPSPGARCRRRSDPPRRAARGRRIRRCPDELRSRARGPAGRCRTGPRTSGSSTIGLPKWKASVVVLLPPCVMTRSTCGSTEVCGTNSAPHMVSGSVYSSCRGPIDTMNRCLLWPSTSTSRRIRSTSALPSEPSDEIDEPAVRRSVLEGGWHLERRIRTPHAGVEAVPGRVERARVGVVRFLREDVEVGVTRADELELRQRFRALLLDPRVERLPGLAVRAVVLRPEAPPTAASSPAGSPEYAGGIPGPGISSGLHDTMRTKGLPCVFSAGNATTLSSTMTSGRTRSRISRSCGSQYIAPSISACHVGCMKVASCSIVGLRNSGAVSRMKSFQNWPASPVSPSVRGRCQVDEVLLEAERGEPALPRRLGGEHDPVAASAQDVADPDAVVRRPVGRLGHEQDGERGEGIDHGRIQHGHVELFGVGRSIRRQTPKKFTGLAARWSRVTLEG